MKRLVVFIGFLLVIIYADPVNAQGAHSADSAAIFSLLAKATASFSRSDYDDALTYCEKAKAISLNKKHNYGEAYVLIKQTDILLAKGDYNVAENLSPHVIAIGSGLKDSLIVAIGYLHMAQVKMYQKSLDEALLYFNKALKTKLGRINNIYAGLAWNDMGYTYGQKGDMQTQADCLMKALRQYELAAYPPGMAMVLSNLSSLFNQLGDFEKAVYYAKSAISIREKINDNAALATSFCNLSQLLIAKDEAEANRYQELCMKYALLANDTRKLAHAYVSSSLRAIGKRDFEQSLFFELKTIQLLENNNLKDGMLASRYIMAATDYAELRRDSMASLQYYQKGIDLAAQLQDKYILRDGYLHRAIFFKERKDFYNAYENIKKYFAYKDSIVSDKTRSDIADIETKYQTEKKDQQIVLLNTAHRIRQLELEKQAALIAGNKLDAAQKENAIILLSKSQQLQQVQIGRQKIELEKQLLLNENKEQQLAFSNQAKLLQQKELQQQQLIKNLMIGGILLSGILIWILFNRYQLKQRLQQQNELLVVRNKIASDLHDDIGSTLTSIKILSQVSKNNMSRDPEKANAFLQKISEQSSEMEQGMSDIVWAIKPGNDKVENMLVRMREYVAHTLECRNINTIFTADETVLQHSLGMQQRHDLFLIFKESVNNAAKYAAASQVRIMLYESQGNIMLSVRDNGVGFELEKTKSSNGLKNIVARATALNGKAEILTAPGEGTKLTFTIPATQ